MARRLTVVGTGYLGATHAACMAELGFEVLGVDVDQAKIAALAAGRVPFFEPGPARAAAQGTSSPAGCGSPPTSPRPPSSATCTSSASAPRSSAGELRRRPAPTSTPRSSALAPVPAPAVPGRRQVDRAGRHREPARRGCCTSSPRPARTWSWPGTPSSCARATPSTTPCARTGWSSASRPSRRRAACCARSYAAPIAEGTPGRRHRPRHRRAGQGRRQRLPGHQDLLHQRDGRGLRGHRRRRARAGRRARPRRPDRRPVPQRRPRLRRRLPAQGHPRASWPAPRSSASARRWPSCARSTRSTSAAAPARSTWPAELRRRRPRPAPGSPCSARRSSPTPTTSATPRRSTSPARCSRRART